MRGRVRVHAEASRAMRVGFGECSSLRTIASVQCGYHARASRGYRGAGVDLEDVEIGSRCSLVSERTVTWVTSCREVSVDGPEGVALLLHRGAEGGQIELP